MSLPGSLFTVSLHTGLSLNALGPLVPAMYISGLSYILVSHSTGPRDVCVQAVLQSEFLYLNGVSASVPELSPVHPGLP